MVDTAVSATLESHLHAITGAQNDYDSLFDIVGDRKLVLIGEASHGTHDFYAERARITRHLIDRCGCNAVAVEADWPDAYRVNRYVMGLSNDADADTVPGSGCACARVIPRDESAKTVSECAPEASPQGQS